MQVDSGTAGLDVVSPVKTGSLEAEAQSSLLTGKWKEEIEKIEKVEKDRRCRKAIIRGLLSLVREVGRRCRTRRGVAR